MKKITYFVLIIILICNIQNTFAEETSVIDKGINFLKLKQDSTGRITQGYSNPSQWAAVALKANSIDASSIRNPEISLKDFLLLDHPQNGAAATDWENRILAIVAIGSNPTNFGGVNYLQYLEAFHNNNQLGETYLLNDDIFGLLALIASGNEATQQIKQNTLDFIIAHQASNGGFSWSPDPTCQFCDPSTDMTAAALQALQQAKNNGLTNQNLDTAINSAKNYLLLNQNSDGGFGYSNTSDADSTSWVLMAFSLLNLSNSIEAINAKNWLITDQQADGGFPSYSGSNSSTTSHALIALSGKSWILNIYDSSSPISTPFAIPAPVATTTPSPSPTPIPTSTPTPTPLNTPQPSPTTTPIASPSPTPTPTPLLIPITKTAIITPSPKSSPEILGKTSTNRPKEIIIPSINKKEQLVDGLKDNALPFAGVFTMFTTFKFLEGRRWKK